VSGLRKEGFVKRVIFTWEFGATSTCVVVEQAKDKEPRVMRYRGDLVSKDTFVHKVLLCVMSHEFGPRDTMHLVERADNQRALGQDGTTELTAVEEEE
jgi:hypothetical protein